MKVPGFLGSSPQLPVREQAWKIDWVADWVMSSYTIDASLANVTIILF